MKQAREKKVLRKIIRGNTFIVLCCYNPHASGPMQLKSMFKGELYIKLGTIMVVCNLIYKN